MIQTAYKKKKKTCIWESAYNFRVYVQDHSGKKHDSRQAGMHGAGTAAEHLHSIHNQEAERTLTGNGGGF